MSVLAYQKVAKEQQFRELLPFVKRIATHMMLKLPTSVSVDDLIQVGSMAAYEALDRYDTTLNIPIDAFVSQRVKGAMIDDLRANDWVSRGTRKLQKDIAKAIAELEHELGQQPKESQIAKKLNLSLPEYTNALTSVQGSQLLYIEDLKSSNSDDANDGNFLDHYLSSDAEIQEHTENPLTILKNKKLHQELTSAINGLPTRELQVMNMYYEDDLQMKEIAAVLSITESRVCQIHSQAIARLRAKLKYH